MANPKPFDTFPTLSGITQLESGRFQKRFLYQNGETDWSYNSLIEKTYRPGWNATYTRFDPFPFPDCTEAQKQTIRDIAERLDAYHKRLSRCTKFPELRSFIINLFPGFDCRFHCTEIPECCTKSPDEAQMKVIPGF